ncbi:MAG: VCBS repeat-containing protein [Anaerolineae bacterium]|nr:VCBS repeat-containing protein [Anaerolineae bacterium]
MAAFGPNPPARTHPRQIIFGDINGDGLLDVFVAAHGYDQAPFSGETNALLLSQPGGSYADASAILPTVPDFSHFAVTGDMKG